MATKKNGASARTAKKTAPKKVVKTAAKKSKKSK
jgi:hypothetical protein